MLPLASCFWDNDSSSSGPAGGGDPPTGKGQMLEFADAKLTNLLLPRGAAPTGLTHAEEYLLPNEDVSRFFRDPGAALRRMEESGRVQGAVAHYSLKNGVARASEQALAVSSSVAWYRTDGGAQAVITDPTMVFVIHRLGLSAAEVDATRIGDESRTFRGFRDGDDPTRAAYLTLFRRENVIGAVLVVVPAATDDGGKLALNLARRQASVQLQSAAVR